MLKSLLYGSSILLLAAIGAGAATLSGTVRAASDGGAQGAVIADAQVILYGFGGVGGGGGLQRPLDTTATNAQGNYEFDSVSTGFKQVVVSKAGYANNQAFTNVEQNSQEVDLDVTLRATGTGGGDFGVVAGTVRAGNSQGAGIENALVVLSRTVAGRPGSNFSDSARTNAQGQFRFDSVPAVNNYVLRVAAAGYNPASNSNVDVDAGDTTTANFSLTAVPGPARPGSIAGTVRKAAGGDPVPGAKVVLSRIGTGRIDSVNTNADGHYAFDSVAANVNYTVTVTMSGFQTAANADIDVVSNQTATVDFSLIASGPVTNRGSIIGTVVDNAKKAVAKARVILSRSGAGGGAGPIDTVETDASGEFSFDSVAALQNYTVTVSAAGYQTAVNGNVDVVAGQAVLADFILVPSGVGLRLDGAAMASFRARGERAALALEFAASPWAGRLSVYDLRGALAFSAEVPAGATRMSLPVKGGARVLVLERGGMAETLFLAGAR